MVLAVSGHHRVHGAKDGPLAHAHLQVKFWISMSKTNAVQKKIVKNLQLFYRVTIQLVHKVVWTSKQRVCFSIYLIIERKLCFDVNTTL